MYKRQDTRWCNNNGTKERKRIADPIPVSYTHLDVYKRQIIKSKFSRKGLESRKMQYNRKMINGVVFLEEQADYLLLLGKEGLYTCLLYTSQIFSVFRIKNEDIYLYFFQ